MKAQSVIFLLAMARYVHACGCTSGDIKSQAYISPKSEGPIDYPTDIPKSEPVNQAGHIPYGVSAAPYTSLVPAPTYVTPPGSPSYAYASYTPSVPEPSAVGIPPVPYYSKNSTSYKIIDTLYSTTGSPLYPTSIYSVAASPTEIAPSYTTYTSVVTTHGSTKSTSAGSTGLPTQVSSATTGIEVTWISWMLMLMVGGMGVGVGFDIRFF
jgi:hypothetical protein